MPFTYYGRQKIFPTIWWFNLDPTTNILANKIEVFVVSIQQIKSKEWKSTARDEVECRDILLFPRHGVFCDLLQYTRTLKRNLFVLYIK